MEVFGLQFDTVWEDKLANYQKALALLEGVEVGRDSLLVFPEMFSSGYSMNVEAVHEGSRGETAAFLARLARQRGAYVVGGLVTRTADGRGLNQAAVFDPTGQEIARYTKIHPFSFAGETEFYAPGREIVAFGLGEFTASVFICYDLRFPEVFRAAVRRGVNLFVVIANWPQPRENHWTTLLKARAIENQAYVVGLNRCGEDPNAIYSGRSLIVGPRGDILADAGQTECIVQAQLDIQPLLTYREQFPALADMQRDEA